jgi:replicative DNA helicase
MSIENRLLNRALNDKKVAVLIERGVDASWFVDETDIRLWQFTKEHFKNYGEEPSEDAITENFPTYERKDVLDNLDYLIDSVIQNRRNVAITTLIRQAINPIENDKDYEGALSAIHRGLVKLEEDGLTESTDFDLTKDPMKRWDEYTERKNLPDGLLGVATGISTIDLATNGLQKGQLIVLVATPKVGKSTLALQIACNVHREGFVPFFQSFEMTNIEQQHRYDSMRARISHARLRTGQLTVEEESRYQAKLRSLEDYPQKFWLSDAGRASTISTIVSKIQLHRPDVVFLDAVYMMVDEISGEMGTPTALTNITRNLKKVAQRFDIPIFITTQALTWKLRKGQLVADSIGYSSSFFQDADVLFGLQREDENVDDTRLLRILASRNTGTAEVSMLWDWDSGQFRELNEDDL